MTNIYDRTEQERFSEELDSITSLKKTRQLVEKYSWIKKRMVNPDRTLGLLITALGFGGAPFVYGMWEAEQAGMGTPFAMMAGLFGCAGAYKVYISTKMIQELQRREKLASKKASKLEQSVEQSEFTNPKLV